jgi:uncharacterized protein (DUF1330 family)
MRLLIIVFALLSGSAMAGPDPAESSEASFNKRFHAADKDKNGMLSRQEAYAEFPLAPEYFDEIDSNKDGQVTLIEIAKARDKRVAAALSAGGKYTLPSEAPKAAAKTTNDGTEFSSKAEARRYYRHEYYESLVSSREKAESRGEINTAEPNPNLMRKSY